MPFTPGTRHLAEEERVSSDLSFLASLWQQLQFFQKPQRFDFLGHMAGRVLAAWITLKCVTQTSRPDWEDSRGTLQIPSCPSPLLLWTPSSTPFLELLFLLLTGLRVSWLAFADPTATRRVILLPPHVSADCKTRACWSTTACGPASSTRQEWTPPPLDVLQYALDSDYVDQVWIPILLSPTSLSRPKGWKETSIHKQFHRINVRERTWLGKHRLQLLIKNWLRQKSSKDEMIKYWWDQFEWSARLLLPGTLINFALLGVGKPNSVHLLVGLPDKTQDASLNLNFR